MNLLRNLSLVSIWRHVGTGKHDSLTHLAVSAGFDAADGDILGECHVSPGGFAHMTHMLSCLAGGKLAVALEVGH
jgi:acetoin utilization deacetylase AcuC-like enzyme